MTSKLKTFIVPVFVKFGRGDYNHETDYTEQSTAIIDAPSMSHFRYGTVRRAYHIGREGWCQDVVFRATSREQVRREVRAALGHHYWQGFHSVNYDQPKEY